MSKKDFVKIMISVKKKDFDKIELFKGDFGFSKVQDVIRLATARFIVEYEKGILLKKNPDSESLSIAP